MHTLHSLFGSIQETFLSQEWRENSSQCIEQRIKGWQFLDTQNMNYAQWNTTYGSVATPGHAKLVEVFGVRGRCAVEPSLLDPEDVAAHCNHDVQTNMQLVTLIKLKHNLHAAAKATARVYPDTWKGDRSHLMNRCSQCFRCIWAPPTFYLRYVKTALRLEVSFLLTHT